MNSSSSSGSSGSKIRSSCSGSGSGSNRSNRSNRKGNIYTMTTSDYYASIINQGYPNKAKAKAKFILTLVATRSSSSTHWMFRGSITLLPSRLQLFECHLGGSAWLIVSERLQLPS
mmetsp:Transcript_19001/g.40932  ORF Transcript_19001/g.40932 Transcript_19001/m.40932 type:complete len:116 (+) Transcript_19001:343-690(+)